MIGPKVYILDMPIPEYFSSFDGRDVLVQVLPKFQQGIHTHLRLVGIGSFPTRNRA